jgi:hypothetical protein
MTPGCITQWVGHYFWPIAFGCVPHTGSRNSTGSISSNAQEDCKLQDSLARYIRMPHHPQWTTQSSHVTNIYGSTPDSLCRNGSSSPMPHLLFPQPPQGTNYSNSVYRLHNCMPHSCKRDGNHFASLVPSPGIICTCMGIKEQGRPRPGGHVDSFWAEPSWPPIQGVNTLLE